MYHDGLLSGRFDDGDFNAGSSNTDTSSSNDYGVCYPGTELLWHSIFGAIIGTVCLLITIWHPSFWLLRFGVVIAGLASFLFFLWLGIAISKRICGGFYIPLPLGGPDTDESNWILGLLFVTILILVVAYSWAWQLEHIVVLEILLAGITILLFYIAFNRIHCVFGNRI